MSSVISRLRCYLPREVFRRPILSATTTIRNFWQPAMKEEVEEEEVPADYDPVTFDPTEYRSPLFSTQLSSTSHPLHTQCEDYISKIGFLLKPIIHDVAPLTQIHRGPNPSLSQLNAVVSARRFSAMAKVHESLPQGTSASIYDAPERIKFKRLDKTAKNIMNILDKEAVEEVKTNREVPDIRPGYIVQLKVEVPENRRRVSIVKGIVIARRNAGLNSTFRLRRLVAGVGVESLFPLYSPNLKEIKVLDKKKVRRAKLYYLRDKMNALKRH